MLLFGKLFSGQRVAITQATAVLLFFLAVGCSNYILCSTSASVIPTFERISDSIHASNDTEASLSINAGSGSIRSSSSADKAILAVPTTATQTRTTRRRKALELEKYQFEQDKDFCEDMPCCFVNLEGRIRSEGGEGGEGSGGGERCSLRDMQRDEDSLVFPGGETRCIFSYSRPYAFQVICHCYHWHKNEQLHAMSPYLLCEAINAMHYMIR